jgi:hypothetical protein
MVQVETEQRHEAAQAIHEALGVRLFKHPPEGFDPLRADERELLVFGYPARPDKDRHPELHETWKRMVSRPLTIIEPQFALRTDKQHGIRNTVANDTSTNWSGAVSFAARGDSATYVIGQWTVPDVVAPGLGSYYCASWVGIDGDGSGDVLQAGTECDIVSFGFFTAKQTYVWWEWYPNYEVQIANFHVVHQDGAERDPSRRQLRRVDRRGSDRERGPVGAGEVRRRLLRRVHRRHEEPRPATGRRRRPDHDGRLEQQEDLRPHQGDGPADQDPVHGLRSASRACRGA